MKPSINHTPFFKASSHRFIHGKRRKEANAEAVTRDGLWQSRSSHQPNKYEDEDGIQPKVINSPSDLLRPGKTARKPITRLNFSHHANKRHGA